MEPAKYRMPLSFRPVTSLKTTTMIDTAAFVTTLGASFLASAVEVVEAFTIVLAVAVVRGLRPALLGTLGGLVVLAAAIAVFGPSLANASLPGLRLAIGVLLLVFGLGWLRKAILRAGGALPLHDEQSAFDKEADALRRSADLDAWAADGVAMIAAFKAVLLEGAEVVFIVLALGARPGLLAPAALGAAAACVLVLTIGAAVHRPLSTIPENTLKFAVGSMLSGFGVFWCCEGLGAPWAGAWPPMSTSSENRNWRRPSAVATAATDCCSR